ncbi:MAG: AraC family transcriptional regulator [Betaproteobacteria bacterium]|nr:MAG: AraC family transcriptional regulator [Betaproteobacteria bacterium]
MIYAKKSLIHVRSSQYMALDVLTDILASLQLRGGVHFRCKFSAPWGMAMKSSPVAEFHLITRGQCWLRLHRRKDAIPLLAGDVVVFPHGEPHALVDSPDGKAVPAEAVVGKQSLEHYGPVVFGGEGIPADILCGYFEFDRASRHALLAALPPLIHIRAADAAEFEWLQTAVRFIAHETREPRPGTDAVVHRLVEVLFIQVLRAYLRQEDLPTGILAALADKQVGAALGLMHGAPERGWSLAMLGKQVAMSRSAFAARFGQLVGQPPMQYLVRLRMEKARELLRADALSIAAIAAAVGYQSEASFSKAFKRAIGSSPGAIRRNSRSAR